MDKPLCRAPRLLLLTALFVVGMSATAAAQGAPAARAGAKLPALELILDPDVAARISQVERSLIFFPRVQLGFELDGRFRDHGVDRDHLLYMQGRSSHYDGASSPGVALFAALTVLAARAPAPLRAALTGNPNLGPALLTDGGIGGAVRLRF